MAEDLSDFFFDLKSPPEHGLPFDLTPEQMKDFSAIPEADSEPQRQERINDVLSTLSPEIMDNPLQNADVNSEPLWQDNVDDNVQETEADREENFQLLEEPLNVVDIESVEQQMRRILTSTTENPKDTYDSPSHSFCQNEIASRHFRASATWNDAPKDDSLERMSSLLAESEKNADGNVQQGTFAPEGTLNAESARPQARQSIAPKEAGLSSRGSRTTNFSARRDRKLSMRNVETTTGGRTYDCARFSTWLTQLRLSKTSYREICKDIDVPILPLLDQEMDSSSQREETELTKIPWLLTPSNSPTLGRIAKDVKYVEQMSVILAEDLFNHLFQLSRSSFLQREEGVHLELWTRFMQVSDVLETAELENRAKQVIKWMESTFMLTNLPVMVESLVKSIDDHGMIRYIVEKAKELYNPDQIEMTPLGSLYSLLTTHGDLLESNKKLTKEKKELDENVKSVKTFLEQHGLPIPKGSYGKKLTRDAKKVIARENGMTSTYAGTRWLIVGCGDAHYAYQCAMLKAARQAETTIKEKRNKIVLGLMEELSCIGTVMSMHEENGDILPGDLVARRVELINKIDAENVRQLPDAECTLLSAVAKTMSSLGKISVKHLFEIIGKNMPSCFRKVLMESEQTIEKLRGVGSLEGMVVGDIVTLQDTVDKESLKNERSKEVVRRKKEHVRECQRVLNTVLNMNANSNEPSGLI